MMREDNESLYACLLLTVIFNIGFNTGNAFHACG